MRPAPSGSTSTAPESKNLLNPRVSACANESACNFSATFFHASSAKRKRHVSSPRVITIFLPSAFAKGFGKVTRFFSSRVCSYSPINIQNQWVPTSSHHHVNIHHFCPPQASYPHLSHDVVIIFVFSTVGAKLP